MRDRKLSLSGVLEVARDLQRVRAAPAEDHRNRRAGGSCRAGSQRGRRTGGPRTAGVLRNVSAWNFQGVPSFKNLLMSVSRESFELPLFRKKTESEVMLFD